MQDLQSILDYLKQNYGDDTRLELGFWDEELEEYYARIVDGLDSDITPDASSMGTGSLTEALKALQEALKKKGYSE